MLEALREEMAAASDAREFERAAALRDTLLMLRRTVRQHARVGGTPEMERESAMAGLRELQDLLELQQLPRVIEAFDISNIGGTHAVAGMVCAVDGLPRRNRYRRFRIGTVEGSDDPAMMAEVVRRRYARLKKEGGEYPGLVLVDGGITQLRAARAALASLGLTGLAAAGLAKQYEEIHYADPGEPMQLPAESDARKVLQRLRDEAHRFAVTYHRVLRGRAIRESVLDEVPGVGPSRKQSLLRHFGSVRRLGRASAEEIAAAPGIGPQLAAEVYRALHAGERNV
jgi:excinuclease ABC subunit C